MLEVRRGPLAGRPWDPWPVDSSRLVGLRGVVSGIQGHLPHAARTKEDKHDRKQHRRGRCQKLGVLEERC